MAMEFDANTRLLSLEQMQNGLKDKKLYTVAELVGLSYPTLKKLADGKDTNPTYETIAAVSAYLINSCNLR